LRLLNRRERPCAGKIGAQEGSDMVDRVADLTMEELKRMIRREVAQRVHAVRREPPDPARAKAALEWLQENRWTPPPGTPTAEEMIREDRDLGKACKR
jgi:hypothetical protein